MRSGMSEVLREGRLLCQKPPSRTHPRKPAGKNDQKTIGKVNVKRIYQMGAEGVQRAIGKPSGSSTDETYGKPQT